MNAGEVGEKEEEQQYKETRRKRGRTYTQTGK
jgi:hypothetical protein